MPSSLSVRSERPIVLDASRLVWRLWTGRLPTGIDRVCLAYLEALADQSLAMLQWRGRRVVLGAWDSDALFALLLSGVGGLDKRRLVLLLACAVVRVLFKPADVRGRVYLNVGHTGLDAPSLPDWLEKKGLAPVYLIHDLIPISHPAYCRPGETEKHAKRMRNALSSARGFIFNSADTERQLARFAHDHGLSMPRQLVAHLGIEPLTAPHGAAPHPRPYFLSIGTIEARKNHTLLLRAWELLRAELDADTPDLVLIGQRGWEAEEAFALLDGPGHRFGKVIELQRCNDAQLAAWIDNARAVLMPSYVEGYGLPVLEAMSRGTPVIASKLAVYSEIAGEVPLLLDPDDLDGWVAAIRDYLGESPDRERQLRALAGYRPPNWEDHMTYAVPWLLELQQRAPHASRATRKWP